MPGLDQAHCARQRAHRQRVRRRLVRRESHPAQQLAVRDARGGDEVVLAAEGEGAEAALDELEALLQRDLDKE